MYCINGSYTDLAKFFKEKTDFIETFTYIIESKKPVFNRCQCPYESFFNKLGFIKERADINGFCNSCGLRLPLRLIH